MPLRLSQPWSALLSVIRHSLGILQVGTLLRPFVETELGFDIYSRSSARGSSASPSMLSQGGSGVFRLCGCVPHRVFLSHFRKSTAGVATRQADQTAMRNSVASPEKVTPRLVQLARVVNLKGLALPCRHLTYGHGKSHE